APVSTTHAIVGAVIGAGISEVGPEPVNWQVMLEITSSLITSPLIGGLIAAGLLYLVKTLIIYRDQHRHPALGRRDLVIAIDNE
ncbi:inorganic phosphate transporter, partial [Rhizobium leguminosarum]|uniref:inorganic phosphate transporter n=1 Tax=Rhizobium leguminosarum TaxID=384 RepID=UPI003F98F4A3